MFADRLTHSHLNPWRFLALITKQVIASFHRPQTLLYYTLRYNGDAEKMFMLLKYSLIENRILIEINFKKQWESNTNPV